MKVVATCFILVLVIASGITCLAKKNFAKCALRHKGYVNNANVTDAQVNETRDEFEKYSFASAGVKCEIDFRALITEIRQEDIDGIVPFQKPKVTYTLKKEDIDRCIAPLKSYALFATCNDVRESKKCMLKSAGFARPEVATKENIKGIKKDMDDGFADHNVHCDTDYDSIIAELRSGQCSTRPSFLLVLGALAVVVMVVFGHF